MVTLAEVLATLKPDEWVEFRRDGDAVRLMLFKGDSPSESGRWTHGFSLLFLEDGSLEPTGWVLNQMEKGLSRVRERRRFGMRNEMRQFMVGNAFIDWTDLVDALYTGTLCYRHGWVRDWSEHKAESGCGDCQGITFYRGMRREDFAEVCCAAATWLAREVAKAGSS